MKLPILVSEASLPVTDIRGAPRRPPHGPKFSQFHAVLWKFWQHRMLAPPGGSVTPPAENPGSTPDYMKTKTSSKKILAPTVRIELVTSGILVCCSPFWANLAFLVSLRLLQSYYMPYSIYMCNALAWIKILLRDTEVKFMWHINDYIATPFPHNKSLHKI